jgi:ATP-dependent exoDNAse (exonuclease V) alpha subunit
MFYGRRALMDALLKGIKKDANIILVGDYYQLPSVGAETC